LIDDTTRSGVHIATETIRSAGRGRRYLNASNGISAFDGPFVESKELLDRYVIVSALSKSICSNWSDNDGRQQRSATAQCRGAAPQWGRRGPERRGPRQLLD
jgi:hypothetical protein